MTMLQSRRFVANRRPRPRSTSNVITTLHLSSHVVVEDLSCPAPASNPANVGLTQHFHIVLPMSGSFQYLESSKDFYTGVNQLLMVPPQREYRINHPVEGDRSMVIFPRSSLIEELSDMGCTPDVDAEVRSASPDLRVSALSLQSAARQGADALMLDELSIDLCKKVLNAKRLDTLAASARRGSTLARARDYLHTYYRDPISLADVATAAGVSPVYLTQLFKRSFGLALHQYLIGLRLNEALFALADAPDLTGLALDLGFSSHSHFTALFRSRFSMTPSAIRQCHVAAARQ